MKNPGLVLADKLDAILKQLAGIRVVVVIDSAEELLDKGGRMRDHELDGLFSALLMTRHDHGVKLVLTTRSAPEPLLRQFPSAAYPVDNGLPDADAMRFLRNLDSGGVYGLGSATEEQLEQIAGSPMAILGRSSLCIAC